MFQVKGVCMAGDSLGKMPTLSVFRNTQVTSALIDALTPLARYLECGLAF